MRLTKILPPVAAESGAHGARSDPGLRDAILARYDDVPARSYVISLATCLREEACSALGAPRGRAHRVLIAAAVTIH